MTVGICLLCGKTRGTPGETADWRVCSSYWMGSVQAHHRYGQALKGQAFERCTVTESVPNNEGNTSAPRTCSRERSQHITILTSRRHFGKTGCVARYSSMPVPLECHWLSGDKTRNLGTVPLWSSIAWRMAAAAWALTGIRLPAKPAPLQL